jgi:hypothetical protein
MTRLRPLLAAVALVAVAQVVSCIARAQQQTPGDAAPPETAKIVGIGATSCSAFLDHIRTDPASERDYLAWAQGFMSGALLRAPEGVDRGLDLMPRAFPLRNQAGFLRRYCETHRDADYSDGVAELYRTLRAPPS